VKSYQGVSPFVRPSVRPLLCGRLLLKPIFMKVDIYESL